MPILQTQFLEAQYRDGTHIDENQLASALMTKPTIADSLIYAMNDGGQGEGSYGLMQLLTQGMGKVGSLDSYEKVGNSEYKWFLQGCETRAIPITGPASQLIRCGQNFSEFVVPLAEKYYSLGFVLRFEDGSQARIVEEPYKLGNNWCYTMQLMGNLPGAFVGTEALEPGKEVGWNYTAYEEGSEGGGMVEATPMWFTNQMSTHRTKTGMTADAKLQKIAFEIERNGKKSRLWLFEKQFQATLQHMRAIERLLWDGRYNKLSDESNAPNIASVLTSNCKTSSALT